MSIAVRERESAGAGVRTGAWATDLEHRTVGCGHFLAEEDPAAVCAALRALLGR
ncbi:hypothetical protein [Streptomyces sp. NPDC006012]|uniref:hypothetical protein n=1 Tax=Streptomyces sp. NPDC006012 TaxID=3364739 RepID=UPI0036A53346